LTKNYKGAEKS